MSVEIQTFVLSEDIDNISGGIADLIKASIYNVYPTGGKWPMLGTMKYYLLLRKATRFFDIPFTVSLMLVDADGRIVENPDAGEIKFTLSGIFPTGYRFFTLCGEFELYIPKTGQYSIYVSANSDGHAHNFRYDLDATEMNDAIGGRGNEKPEERKHDTTILPDDLKKKLNIVKR